MPRRIGLIPCLAGLLAAAPALACTPALDLRAGSALDLHVSAPCAPYRPVVFAYGPFRVAEETGALGTADIRLPLIEGAGPATVTLDGAIARADPPAGSGSSRFLWIEPSDFQPGLLPATGFPTPGALRPELRILGDDRPDHLDLTVTAANCGRLLRFGLLRDGWDAPRPVSLTVPGCAMTGAVLRLPVPAE